MILSLIKSYTHSTNGWMLGFNDSVHIKDDNCRSEWVTPGGAAIPGMTSLKDGYIQRSSALAQSPEGDIEPNHLSEINPNSDNRSNAADSSHSTNTCLQSFCYIIIMYLENGVNACWIYIYLSTN